MNIEHSYEEEKGFRRGFHQGFYVALKTKLGREKLLNEIMNWRCDLTERTKKYKCPPGSCWAGAHVYSPQKKIKRA